MTGPGETCYIDGELCDCGALDVVGVCPRDPYYHEEEEFMDEDAIDLAYNARSRDHDDEIERF